MNEMRQLLKAALRRVSARHGEPVEADHRLWDDMVDATVLMLRQPDRAMCYAGANEIDDWTGQTPMDVRAETAEAVFTVMIDTLIAAMAEPKT